MQFIATFFWSAILVSMLNYVVSAVQGVPFNFMMGIYISLVVSVLVFVLASLIPNETAPEKH